MGEEARNGGEVARCHLGLRVQDGEPPGLYARFVEVIVERVEDADA